jgi:recombination protein RecR
MSYELPVLRALIDHFRKMPGIGEKTARRLAFAIFYADREEVEDFAEVLLRVKERIRFCSICGNLAESDTCRICNDPKRECGVVCIVERPADIYFFEKIGNFRGRYHVLHGLLSPLDGVGAGDLNIEGLKARIDKEGIEEVILATSTSVEGDTTALYISEVLRESGVKVSRLARGIPMGSTLEYINGNTLAKAFETREEI